MEVVELEECTNNEPVYKILLVGNCRVGKSCIVNRYCEDEFCATYIQTEGIELKVKHATSLGKKLKLTIWDASGKSLASADKNKLNNFTKAATGILFVYDISNKQSFLDIPKWIKILEEHKDVRVQECLIGNKSDLSKDRVITKDEGNAFSLEREMRFFETSAKSKYDQEIMSAFQMMIHDMKLQYDKTYSDRYEKGETKEELTITPNTFSRRCRKLICCCPCFGGKSDRKNK